MMRHGTAAVTTSTPKSLQTALGLPDDQHVRYLSVQPYAGNAAVVYIGGPTLSGTLSSTNYGCRLEIPVTSIPSAPFIVTDAQRGAGIKLSDVWVVGTTNDKLSVMWSPHE